MKHEIIIHAGMPKTGTSAIQRALHGATMPGFAYVNWGDQANHSPAFITGFTDRAFADSFDRGRGRSRDDILALRQRYRDELVESLAASTESRLVLSAEAFGSVGGEDAMRDLRDLLAPFTGSLRVIVYIRPLSSALPSVFQQGCKFSQPRKTIIPTIQYRKHVGSLLGVFGDAVSLVPYLPSDFPQGDVVLDFCNRIGVSPILDTKRENTAMSAEAAALLFFHGRHQVQRPARPDALKIQAMLVRWIQHIGGTKLRYSSEVLSSYVRTHKAELDWISEKAGFDVAGLSGTTEGGVGSIEDLRALALEVEPALRDIIRARSAVLKDDIGDIETRLAQIEMVSEDDLRLAAQIDLLKDMTTAKIDAATILSRTANLIPERLGVRDFARKMRRFIPGQRV